MTAARKWSTRTPSAKFERRRKSPPLVAERRATLVPQIDKELIEMKWSMFVGSLVVSLGLCSQSMGLDLSNRIRGSEIKYCGNSCSEPNCCKPADSDETSCCKQAEEPTCEEPTCEEKEPACGEKSDDAKCCKHKHKRTGPFSQMFKTHKKCKPAGCDKPSCCKQPEPEKNGCPECCKTTRNGLLAALHKHHQCCNGCNHCR